MKDRTSYRVTWTYGTERLHQDFYTWAACLAQLRRQRLAGSNPEVFLHSRRGGWARVDCTPVK